MTLTFALNLSVVLLQYLATEDIKDTLDHIKLSMSTIFSALSKYVVWIALLALLIIAKQKEVSSE